MVNSFKIQNVEVGGGTPFFILGPCGLENEEFAWDMAQSVKKICERLDLSFIFKASYDKANRTSVDSFRGPGVEAGCRILGAIGKELGIPVTTDIHTAGEAEIAAECIDLLQVPAFLCRQTDILEACAATGRVVNVKKGQFLAPADCVNIAEKLKSFGCDKFLITERGTTFGYNNLVADMRSIPIMQEFGYPVVFDATHSAQLPGGDGKTTGGMRSVIPTLARSAVAAGCNGIFMEVHDNIHDAKSDASTQWPLDQLEPVLSLLAKIRDAVDS